MRISRYAGYAWIVLGYNLLVILWGALVRATGSGAGCGAHWPTCQGQVIPQAASTATMIEFTHRIMSGLVLILVAGLVVGAFRKYPRGHIVRTGATLAGVFTITEALVGAGLVLFELVASNTSAARAAFISVHLVNTFLLLASITLTAWWASGGRPLRLSGQGGLLWALALGWLGLLILGASGAVTALGDTLFPSKSLAEGFQQDFSPTVHFLIRLRVYHPLIAVFMGIYVTVLGFIVRSRRRDRFNHAISLALVSLFLVQLGIGVMNVILLAPMWIQLVHLLTADLTWISLVLMTGSALQVEQGGEALRKVRLAEEAGG